ncbi:MAG: PA0069 family radical SAM protein [Pseudomonadota bacterium]
MDIGESARRGRGALRNPAGRFEPYQRERVDDGWDDEGEDTVLRTEVATERPRTILTRNTSPDVPFDRSINPYRGCEHGCVYCFARPSHAFLDLSPGLDFETRLTAKPDAPKLLARELSAPSYKPAPIAIGTNTDPYQPIEARLRIMRGILETLQAAQHPVTIVTKGSLIERDIDILSPMAQRGLAHAGISVTTLDRRLSRKMEPRAPAPERRLETIRRLTEAGIPVRVLVAPVIPGLTDSELDTILERAREAGAATCGYILLRLPGEVSDMFNDWLTTLNPARARKIMSQIRQMHNGRDYNSSWGTRKRGQGQLAELLARRFTLAARRLGYAPAPEPLRCDLFRPAQPEQRQLDLFA